MPNEFVDDNAARNAHRAKVALVNMPWARCDSPSIQCGLLQAILQRQGHDCTSFYFNLEICKLLGVRRYNAISDIPSERLYLFGEWLFTPAAFGAADSPEEYLRLFPGLLKICKYIQISQDDICELRNHTLPAWLDEIAERPVWQDHDIIGFTSTFSQNVAALALAKRIKRRYPQVQVIFGGANYDDEMGPEYMRHIPEIDYVVIGEGDRALPRLVEAIADGNEAIGIPGVCARRPDGTLSVPGPAPLLQNLDTLPVPDYSDYFDTLDRLGKQHMTDGKPIRLLAELSRGCWWGEKHHCTFCGLNNMGMKYRAKSSARVISEIEQLARKHQVRFIDTVDNIIDMKYITGLCAELEAAGWDLDIFYEVKANLTREQVAALAAAGVRRIQPGIESLSTNVLRLMRKGTTRLMNVRLLKWARYYDVRVSWNMLSGFPGETDEDYYQQIRLMPLLSHLQPPATDGRNIWLERFSPFYTDRSLGFENIQPRAAYRYAYPIPGMDHSKIAYFFSYTARNTASRKAVAAFGKAIAAWQDTWEKGPRPRLVYVRGPGWIKITDTRGGRCRQVTIRDWRAAVVEICGPTARSAARIHSELSAIGFAPAEQELNGFLHALVRDGIVLEEDGRFLSLALPQFRLATSNAGR
ncbi:MAG: RiPP maturation radical SAM C-methyltransferase [Streptosporangiaceae bacterium]|nr:RiPP maturation radical SAM C-methyltransferase [Streptosporangiaceae bacterium]